MNKEEKLMLDLEMAQKKARKAMRVWEDAIRAGDLKAPEAKENARVAMQAWGKAIKAM